MTDGRLQDKVTLITGGTSGIGAATVRLFVQEGAQVAFTGRRREKGEALAQAMGHQSHYIYADHTQLADCERCVAETVSRYGRVDILFNNAGIVTSGTAETTSWETWQATMELNVTAVWQMSRLVLPHFRAQGGGVIINNASDWGLVGGKNALAYCASKGAVVQMTRSMALDHARENIRINAVCPGDTFVERWVEKGYFEDSDPVTIKQGLAETGAALPMGRVGQAEEVAKAVLFLACGDSSFITGVLLPVDGGNTAA
ncbi:MAG: SDR family oxidoreductase [Chloroflexi bacterium]|nr:SDR family oxidoreductase [Ardenticatenaceae bacterium]MBL1131202.1 SDR family oxidoreductase [Chloroflexota bacterium]NOG37303.1 SDR family oxidoreductase [Chloroflexota bacterium]